MSLEKFTVGVPACEQCSQEHISYRSPPQCCHQGRVDLSPEEVERLNLPPEIKSLDLTDGCSFWRAKKEGCTAYPNRPQACRAFPLVDFYSALLARSSLYDCRLIRFFLSLWEKDLAQPRLNHPDEDINGLCLFGPSDPEVLNFFFYYDDPHKEVDGLLAQIEEHNKTALLPVIVLFYADSVDGGIRPTKPFSLTDIEQLKHQAGYQILAGLAYPSLKSLPPRLIDFI